MNKSIEYMDEPAAPYFVIASSDNFDKTGSWEVPKDVQEDLGRHFNLTQSEVAAHAYLSSHRAEEFALEAELAAYAIDSELSNG